MVFETVRRARHRILRSEEHTSELQSPCNLVCRLLLEKKKLQRPSGSFCWPVQSKWPGPSLPLPHPIRLHPPHPAEHMPKSIGKLLLASSFFFNDTATPEIYTLSLHDALPIYLGCALLVRCRTYPPDGLRHAKPK